VKKQGTPSLEIQDRSGGGLKPPSLEKPGKPLKNNGKHGKPMKNNEKPGKPFKKQGKQWDILEKPRNPRKNMENP